MKKTSNRLLALLLALVMTLSCVTPAFAADAKTLDEVREEILALSADANDYTPADRERVEAIQADFDALSAEDQAILDEECTHTGTGQPLGRVLQSALWTVWSFDAADDRTTLPDGVYNASSTPALSSEYSKGKSTSGRQKPWSVTEVTVENGRAVATIMVESGTYTGIMLHGTTYERTGGTSSTSEFAGVPIDLNSTFYFNGVSSSMSVPIAFSLTTVIEEPEGGDDPITETFGFTLQVGQYVEGTDFHTASFEGVTYALTDSTGTVWEPANATSGMLTYSQLDAAKTYVFTASKEGWAVVYQGEWNVEAHAYEYIFTGEDEIRVTITKDDDGKNITDATNQGMIFRKKPREENDVDRALALVPADLSIFTQETAAAVEAAVAAADPTVEDTEALAAMAEAVMTALQGLVPLDGSYMAGFEHTGNGMFKIIDVVSLDVSGGEMTLHFINGSKTFIKLFLGTVDEANAADESEHILPGEETTASNGKAGYNWVVPVSALQTEIRLAAYSKSKNTFNSTGNFLVKANSLEKLTPAEPERIDLEITNNTGMFKAVTAYLELEDGETTLVMALGGTGYHELYKGTYEQAVANGDGSADAGNDSWIHGYENADGKWEFRIPVSEGETYMPMVAVSNSYYTKYLNGQNSLGRAFYPRQIELNREAGTLVTGDYEYQQELEVTNNVKMFKVSSAVLDTVGGPNSNNYKANLALTMGSTSFDKAYVGRATEIGESTETVALNEGNVFELPVKWVQEFGKPETLKNLLDEPFIVSFHSVKNDAWYERQFTVSEAASTLVIDPVYADYSAVDAALAKVPEDLSIYTEESVAVLQAAIDAVVRDLTSDKQAEVDAMAQAIEDAIAALVEKPAERLDAPVITETGNTTAGKPTLTWDAVEGAVEYAIYRSGYSNGTYTKMYSTTKTSYTNTGATVGYTFYYKVCAVDADGNEGAFCEALSIHCRPGKPSITGANGQNATGKPTLTWKAVEGAAKYVIYRSGTSTGTYSKLETTSATTCTDSTAKAGYTYYYKVFAVDSKDYWSAASTVIGVRCRPARPVVTGSNNTAGKPYLTWEAVTGAEKYVIYRSESKDGTYNKLYDTSRTSFTNIGAELGKTYYYKVYAVDANSFWSVASEPVSVYCCVAAPTVTGSTGSNGKPYLTWGAVDGAKEYVVYRSGNSTGTYTKLYTTTRTDFTNTGAKAGYTYWYKVYAVDASGRWSVASAPVSAKCTK